MGYVIFQKLRYSEASDSQPFQAASGGRIILDFYHTLFVAVTQLFLGGYVMLLIDFRKPVAVWRARWIATVGLVVCANLFGLLFLNFWDTYVLKFLNWLPLEGKQAGMNSGNVGV